jgi:hypothetical protein
MPTNYLLTSVVDNHSDDRQLSKRADKAPGIYAEGGCQPPVAPL